MQFLNIDNWYDLTDNALISLSKIFLNLQELSIQCNKNISIKGLINFSKNNSKLLKLNIQYCENINPKSKLYYPKYQKYFQI